jgi:hypothetical protein
MSAPLVNRDVDFPANGERGRPLPRLRLASIPFIQRDTPVEMTAGSVSLRRSSLR